MSLFSVTPQGVITVDTSSIRSDFVTAYTAALGADLDTDVSTAAGQLITNDTQMLTTAQQECVNMANDYNVYYATGHALDVAAAFYGYYRKAAIATVVVATISGTAGTIIPSGSIVSDGTNEYKLLNNITIGEGGNVNAQFQAIIPGPIACPANTLTKIITAIPGWDAVNNPYDGIIGANSESDNMFRGRITANWLNKRARSILGAIIDNIAALPDVISVIGRENPTKTQQTIDGVVMAPNSIYIAVVGGEGGQIAKILAGQKTLGAATVGNTTVGWTDEDINYNYTYNIGRPSPVALQVLVQYRSNNYTGADIGTQIQQTIMSYISGNPFLIGQVVSGAELASALREFNQADLLSIKVRVKGQEDWGDYVNITISQIASLSLSDITIEAV